MLLSASTGGRIDGADTAFGLLVRRAPTKKRAIEAKFRRGPQRRRAAGLGLKVTCPPRPTTSGTPHDKTNRRLDAGQVQGMGLGRADRDLLRALPPRRSPKSWSCWATTPFTAKLHEPGVSRRHLCAGGPRNVPAAPTSPIRAMGDVTAPLVYANYGMPEDYIALARAGIDVKGKIRQSPVYGGGWRGLKAAGWRRSMGRWAA